MKCRICGRTDFHNNNMSRGIHESVHYRRGEIEWTGPKPRVGGRPFIFTALGKSVFPNTELLPDISQPNTEHELDAIGRKRMKYSGQPCEVCGKTGFSSTTGLFTHRNWHVRNGEARWEKVGSVKNLIKITTDTPTTLTPNQSNQSNQSNQIDIIDEVALIAADNAKSAAALRSLQSALVLLQVAQVVNEMSPEQALQVIGTLRTIGKVRR